MTDGAFTRGGRFRPAPALDLAMLAWPHSGFGAHVGPVIAGDDRASLTRVARYGARAPIAEDLAHLDTRAIDARAGPWPDAAA